MENFTPGKMGKVYILRLDPGEMLVESVEKLILSEDIDNAVIVSGIGSLCRVNVLSPGDVNYPPDLKAQTYEDEPFEIAGISGFIADGKAHIHFTLGNADKVLAGHAGYGNKVLYLAEIIICEIEGLKLKRSPNEKGINALGRKS